MRQVRYNIVWFTLTELLVSITMSVLVLGGIFYFISETLLGLARTSSQSQFLKSFYTFSSILDSWDFEILSNNGYHVWLLESPNTWEWIIIWVIDTSTYQLISLSDADKYLPAVIAYRQVSASEIEAIRWDTNIIYSFEFLPDTVFKDFFVSSFQFQAYNSTAIHELQLEIFPTYFETFRFSQKSQVDIEDIQSYSLVF